MKNAYQKSGVNIELGNRVKSYLPDLLSSTNRKEVLGKVGGFGGLFQLKKYNNPVLVSSVDGVGTKLKIAFSQNKHNTIGEDLVNHCVNDIAVVGAEPLFFLDYIGMGKLEANIFEEIIKGFVNGCKQNNCTLIGGETAQMPGFYKKGEYDVSGTIVGVVEKDKMITGEKIKTGNCIIGIKSNGLHTNGYSLARKVLCKKYGLNDYIQELKSTLADELLRVHVSYLPLVKKLYKYINGIAHITGGGFYDNIPRIIPKGYDVLINKSSWKVPPIFKLIQEIGNIDEKEMYHVFNMGIGMVFVIDSDKERHVLNLIRKNGYKAWNIGEIIDGISDYSGIVNVV